MLHLRWQTTRQPSVRISKENGGSKSEVTDALDRPFR